MQVRSVHGWLDCRPGLRPPKVEETSVLEARGLRPGAVVTLGPIEATSRPDGTVLIPLREHMELFGHIGLIAVSVDGEFLTEIDVVPDKMSEPAYRQLVRELENTWVQLFLDPYGVASTQATTPSARELWSAARTDARAIAMSPRRNLRVAEQVRELTSVRRASEMTPGLLRAGAVGRRGIARITEATDDVSENRYVVDTMQRLATYARRKGEPDVEEEVKGVLRRMPRRFVTQMPVQLPFGCRTDPRYRRMTHLRHQLQFPEAQLTDGPGELRLGVKGLHRLYEFWVFLRVLEAARELYGPPVGPGFDVLAQRRADGVLALDLPAGTTVRFPGDVYVAFEPEIRPDRSGWRSVEYVPHPDPALSQAFATPDVVVLRESAVPEMVVIDAKYVGRHFVELSAATLHAKYARMRLGGRPVVSTVLAAHPHIGRSAQWAGYGYVPFVPGTPHPVLPLPRIDDIPESPSGERDAAATTDNDGSLSGIRASASLDLGRGAGDVVVAHGDWTRSAIGPRRIDLTHLRKMAGAGRAGDFVFVLPDLPHLQPFQRAAAGSGWTLHLTDVSRSQQLAAMVRVVESAAEASRDVVVISDDGDLRAALRRFESKITVRWFTDLSSVDSV